MNSNIAFQIVSLLISAFLFAFLSELLPIGFSFLVIGFYYYYTYLGNKNLKYKWLMPPFFFTFVMFVFIFVGSLMIYTGTLAFQRFNSFIFNTTNLNRANFLTIFSCSTLWVSYLFFAKKNKKKTYFLADRNINKYTASVLVFVSVLVYAYGISKGYIGYSKKEEQVGSLSSLINMLSQSVNFVFLLYYFLNYKNIALKKYDFVFLLLLSFLVVMGVVSGSKFKMASPLLYVFLIDYYNTNKLIGKKVVYMFMLLLFAFAIIPSVRAVLDENKNQEQVDLVNLVEDVNIVESDNSSSAFIRLLSRVTYTPQLILAINYNGLKPDAVLNLWYYKLMSPSYVIIPRFLNPDKPKITFGKWFSYYVFGSTKDTNIGATYQGILYMNGGLMSVFFGFFILGLFQALIIRFVFNEKFIIIYFQVFLSFVFLPQEPWVLYTSLLQSLVFFMLMYKFIVKNESVHRSNARLW